jgi:hypothetical protein
MTQVWPGFGAAPVPTVVSMICKPDGVVMGFPADWAVAVVTRTGVETAAAMTANAVWMIVRRDDRIYGYLSLIKRKVSSATGQGLPPRPLTQIRRAGEPARRLI